MLYYFPQPVEALREQLRVTRVVADKGSVLSWRGVEGAWDCDRGVWMMVRHSLRRGGRPVYAMEDEEPLEEVWVSEHYESLPRGERPYFRDWREYDAVEPKVGRVAV